MSESLESFFGSVVVNEDGTQKVTYSTSATTVRRSYTLFATAQSTLAIHISGTATVQVISNPFGESDKDAVIDTITASDRLFIPSAMNLVLNITAISGTVTAVITNNED